MPNHLGEAQTLLNLLGKVQAMPNLLGVDSAHDPV